MIGGGLYVHHGSVVDALMPSVAGAYAEHRPAYALALHTMRWARERGMRWYNWQGSPPGGGVHRFKQQWGSRDCDYSFLTWVTGDAGAYQASSIDEIRSAYPWHYVLPFDRIGKLGEPSEATGSTTATSSRASAWAAIEESRR
jgi:hypothetical protein